MKQSFINNGYVVLKNAITSSLAHNLFREAREIEAKIPIEAPLIVEGIHCGDEWSNCVPRYPAFAEVGKGSILVNLVEEILQSSCELVLYVLLRISPGQGDTLWHQDIDILHTKAKIGVTFSLFGSEGFDTALKVVPNSQGWPFPTREQMQIPHPDEIALNISRQTAILHDPLLWHTSVLNSSEKKQWLLFLFYKIAE